MGRAGGRLVFALVVVGTLLTVPSGAWAGHQSAHFERSYEGSHTVVWGAPGQGGGFVGSVFCNAEADGPSTGACVRYKTGGFDHSGSDFEVTLTDFVFGQQTAFLVGFDITGSGNIDCTGSGGGPDRCFFGRGTVTGKVPDDAGDEVLWVYPATVHSSGFLCCPQSFATVGVIEITFSG